MTAAYLDTQPHLLDKWASLNPFGRIGRPDELRGVVTWLASDASTFCTGSECVPFSCFYILTLRRRQRQRQSVVPAVRADEDKRTLTGGGCLFAASL